MADTAGQVEVMQGFVVAVEYRGADIADHARRRPVCEHAYDLQTATLAGHGPDSGPRVAFPPRQRGWNTESEVPRCLDCESAVDGIIRQLISGALPALIKRQRPQ